MNKRIHLLYGLLLGLTLALLTAFLFVRFVLGSDFLTGIEIVKSQGNFGKLLTLSALPNLPMFFIFYKYNREFWARGLILATILLAITSIFYL